MESTIPGKLPTITDQQAVAAAYRKQAGEQLRVRLAVANMSQTDLASRLHVSQQWVARRIRGESDIALGDIARIALILDIPRSALIPA